MPPKKRCLLTATKRPSFGNQCSDLLAEEITGKGLQPVENRLPEIAQGVETARRSIVDDGQGAAGTDHPQRLGQRPSRVPPVAARAAERTAGPGQSSRRQKPAPPNPCNAACTGASPPSLLARFSSWIGRISTISSKPPAPHSRPAAASDRRRHRRSAACGRADGDRNHAARRCTDACSCPRESGSPATGARKHAPRADGRRPTSSALADTEEWLAGLS
jgi:hypothetical protein